MAKHRELARELYSARIWRSVVFAGAMLGAPTIASADTPPTRQAATKPAPPKPEGPADKAKRIEVLDTERKALYAKLAVAEVAELDKVKREINGKDAAIRKLVDEIMNMRKPRPRTPPEARPIGRGFVLA
jgi:hypothetical protein